MSKAGDWHNQAMALTDAALRKRRQGKDAAAKEFFGQALQQELAAIADLDESDNLARSILHRSAGWLALDCGQPRLAEKLACAALAGDPDPAMAHQLREVLTAAHKRMEVDGSAAPEKAQERAAEPGEVAAG